MSKLQNSIAIDADQESIDIATLENELPTWMASKKKQIAQKKRQAQLKAEQKSLERAKKEEQKSATSLASPQTLSFKERLQNTFSGASGTAYAISLVVHMVLMLLLSLFAFQQYSSYTPTSPLLAGESTPIAPVDEVIDTRTELLESATAELAVNQIESPPDEISEIKIPEVSNETFNQEKSEGKGEGISLDGLPFAMPTRSKVVTKGNFSAWTVPADPIPRQSYFIVIQIKLPKNVRRYYRGDLSGNVWGTDGYFQSITVMDEEEKKKRLPLDKNVAQMVIAVPGGDQLVEDRIFIKSKRLNEEQNLKIEF